MSKGSEVLLLVDVQRDFLPGGALAVPHGDEVVPLINALIPRYASVLATQDWHPAGHCSFATNHPGRKPGDVIDVNGISQVLWPPHCVQGSRGAEFAPGLNAGMIGKTFLKGIDPGLDSYSAFFDNAKMRIQVTVMMDACRGMELNPGDTERAFAQMRAAGAALTLGLSDCA